MWRHVLWGGGGGTYVSKELAASMCPEGESSRSLRDSGKDSGLLQSHNCKLEFIYVYTVRIRKGHGGLLC